MQRIDLKEYLYKLPMDAVLEAEKRKSISPRVLDSDEIERGMELELYEMDGEVWTRIVIEGAVILDEANEDEDPLNFIAGDTRYVIHLV